MIGETDERLHALLFCSCSRKMMRLLAALVRTSVRGKYCKVEQEKVGRLLRGERDKKYCKKRKTGRGEKG
jgi:hypothetical protein